MRIAEKQDNYTLTIEIHFRKKALQIKSEWMLGLCALTHTDISAFRRQAKRNSSRLVPESKRREK